MSTTYYRVRAHGKPRLPPVDHCDLCGRSLLCVDRYHVKLVLKEGPLAGSTLRVLHVCRSCLEGLKRDKKLRGRLRVRYYKMQPLCRR